MSESDKKALSYETALMVEAAFSLMRASWAPRATEAEKGANHAIWQEMERLHKEGKVRL